MVLASPARSPLPPPPGLPHDATCNDKALLCHRLLSRATAQWQAGTCATSVREHEEEASSIVPCRCGSGASGWRRSSNCRSSGPGSRPSRQIPPMPTSSRCVAISLQQFRPLNCVQCFSYGRSVVSCLSGRTSRNEFGGTLWKLYHEA
jgi:hypothetical protein